MIFEKRLVRRHGVINDFNARLTLAYRKGGAKSGHMPCKDFGTWVQRNDLIDIGTQGPSFTWCRDNLMERIDRAFFNTHWLDKLSECTVLHLSRVYSDHHPILVKTASHHQSRRKGHFKFLLPWVTHANFRKVVERSWAAGSSISDSINKFKEAATKWNIEEFGHIGRKKRTLQNRIQGIQKTIENRYSEKLRDLESTLLREYEEVLMQEELL